MNRALIRWQAVELKLLRQVENRDLELLFGTETVEAYRQLAALTTAKETSQLATLEIEDAVAIEPKPATNIETATIPDFESFFAAQPKREEPVTLEVIKEQANEQPLEQTFVQLVELLSETEVVPEQNRLNFVHNLK